MITPGRMLEEVLHSLGKKPATGLYPFESAEISPHFRGRLNFVSERCIGCKMCMRDCPAGAIVINKVGEKKFEAVISLDKCIYCGQCVDSCPRDALQITTNFELASLTRDTLKITFHAKPAAEPEKKA